MHDAYTFCLPGSSVSNTLLLLVQTVSGIKFLAGFPNKEQHAPCPQFRAICSHPLGGHYDKTPVLMTLGAAYLYSCSQVSQWSLFLLCSSEGLSCSSRD